jgi:DNA (cytosine-5)-methyltransferase 1
MIRLRRLQYSLSASANFGVPQDRERFFIIAALTGNPIPPSIAEPTHYSPARKNIDVHLHGGGKTFSTPSKPGWAAFPQVTIEDAISDLPRFDWYVSFHMIHIVPLKRAQGCPWATSPI